MEISIAVIKQDCAVGCRTGPGMVQEHILKHLQHGPGREGGGCACIHGKPGSVTG